MTSPQPTLPAVRPGSGSQYAHLLRLVKAAGLLERRSTYYRWKIAVTTALFLGGWVAFVLIGRSWWQLATAAFLAFVFTQLGFLGHDAGHRQMFRSHRANYVVGVLHANLAIGLSYGWWVDKHNRHHAHPNEEGKDPDIDIGALAFTAAQASGRGRIAAAIYRRQAYLFFPMLLLEAISLHLSSVRALAKRATGRSAWETALFGVHVVGYLTTVFLVLSPLQALVFVLAHQGLFGLYLGCSFAPNHKGMAILDPDDRTDYLRRQVLTSRNVRGHWLTDFMLGGLNYQIEHHLFPSMPRPNLRRAQEVVRQFCRAHDLTYCQTGLLTSYAQALRHLHAVGRTPQAAGA
ncbi:fatty acid desaturase family protein [Dactylosporangium sp. McL0621]|uniref:fatty acid desaturase family protein n=1 Tax=Dactylosporangium sp. McL0621 TaxID=3415678 RepID=UPI003CEB9CFF